MSGPDYSRFSGNSFERLVRALAFKNFGPGGTVFSPGPDGGRDYLHVGKFPAYKSRGWDGTLIIQSKFKEKLSHDYTDANWLVSQLAGERESIRAARSKMKGRLYYIIATNVALSGVESSRKTKKGGIQKISDELLNWKSVGSISDFDIWPADKISDLLAGAEDVRRHYSAWLTPSDVINAILSHLDRVPHFEDVIRLSLKTSLARDKNTRLKDAGSVTDLQIRTSQVFVDLPFSLENTATPAKSDDAGLVSHIIKLSRDCFSTPENENSLGNLFPEPSKNRLVVLGGPGQGKSTASLFAAQLFRANLILNGKNWKTDPNLTTLVPEILDRAKSEGLDTNIPLRYPVHISLPNFADSISEARRRGTAVPTILSYISDTLSRSSDSPVDRSDVRAWLGAYPWVIILDGLDEVPPSGERPEVLSSVSRLVTEIADLNADALIIVTTRPQGYNKDLDSTTWEHRYLSDLPTSVAIRYAQALNLAHYPDDADRRRDLNIKMLSATAKPATSRLMTSPLQVTIMHMIVDTGGSVPTARWTLFNEYFEVLKRREKAKGGETQQILERNISYLAPIHQRVGLILQASSELTGGAGSSMPHEVFRDLLTSYLGSEGFEGTNLETRVSELMYVALHRLVLLSSREEGKIAFDVRSLQEYMAAAALTAGDDSTMEARLLHIAGKAHWQHVFLIAASRCFSEDTFHHRRVAVVNIPRQLETERCDVSAQTGAHLAFEMFLDGLGADHPNFRRQLAKHALELLNKTGADFDPRLISLWEDDTRSLISTFLKDAVQLGGQSSAGAWRFLGESGRQRVAGIDDLLAGVWPKSDERVLEILDSVGAPLPRAFMVPVVRAAIVKNDGGAVRPSTSEFLFRLQKVEKKTTSPSHDTLSTINPFQIRPQADARVRVLESEGIQIGFTYLGSLSPSHDLSSLRGTGWSVAAAIGELHITPSKETLATVLTELSDEQAWAVAPFFTSLMPWPLLTAYRSASSREEVLELASQARQGNFGDSDDWFAAEVRWRQVGVTARDLTAGRNAFFQNQIRHQGMPIHRGISVTHMEGSLKNSIVSICEIASNVDDNIQRKNICDVVSFACLALADYQNLSGSELKIIVNLLDAADSYLFPHIIGGLTDDAWRDASVLDFINQHATKFYIERQEDTFGMLGKILSALQQSPTRSGFYYLIMLIAVMSGDRETISYIREAELAARSTAFHCKNDIEEGCVALIRMISRPHSAEDWEDDISILIDAVKEPRFSYILSNVFLLGMLDNIMALRIVQALCAMVNSAELPHYGLIYKAMRRTLDARNTYMKDELYWTDVLKLPRDANRTLQHLLSSIH